MARNGTLNGQKRVEAEHSSAITRSLLAKNGRKWVLADHIWPTTLSAALFQVHPLLAKKHRELPFLTIAQKIKTQQQQKQTRQKG